MRIITRLKNYLEISPLENDFRRRITNKISLLFLFKPVVNALYG